MSSHHIVRENQEPALLIQEFNSLDNEYIGQLLEWSPTIISNVESLDFLLAEDIKIDVLFTTFDVDIYQAKVKTERIVNNYLDDSLNYLINNKHKAVNILLDQVSAEIVHHADKINIVQLSHNKRYIFVKDTFEKWKPKGDLIYVSEDKLKSFQGLKFRSKDIFEVEKDGFISVEFNSPDFVLLGEEI